MFQRMENPNSIMEEVLGEFQRMVRTEFKQIYKQLDRTMNKNQRHPQIAQTNCLRAQLTTFDGFDRRFDKFAERVQTIIVYSQKKQTPLVDDAQDVDTKNLVEEEGDKYFYVVKEDKKKCESKEETQKNCFAVHEPISTP